MTKRLEAIVHGLVQGVSFRYYTRQQAQRLGLTGWVANRPDGTVQVVAEGPDTALGTFSNFLLAGPPHARVDLVAADWLDATGEFRGFTVRYL
jgi:acylphosphatase